MSTATRTISTKFAVEGEATYKAAVENINRNLKVLSSDLSLVSDKFKGNENSMEAVKAKTEALNAVHTAQKNKLKELSDALQNAQDSANNYGAKHVELTNKLQSNKAAMDALNKSSDYTAEAMTKLVEENKKLSKELSTNDTKFDAAVKSTQSWKTQLNSAEAGVIKTEAALKDVNQELKTTDKELDSAGKGALKFSDILKANLLSDAIMGGIRLLGTALRSAVNSMVDFAKQGIEVASNLTEVQNVVDVTFGRSADVIDEFAKKAAVSFGLSELSAKQFSGTMGAMLKSTGLAGDAVLDMSTKLTGLSGDLASFYNLDVETAFQKLRSGISGEIEPLKQLGINLSVANLEAFALSQGMTKAYSSLSEAEKVTLRYNYILKVTADAQGDFTRTSDSYANQQRILQLQIENLSAALGEKLLPNINGITTALNEMLSGEISAEEFGKRIGQTLSEMVGTITAQLPQFVGVGGEIVISLLEGLTKTIPTIVDDLVEAASNISMTFLSILPDMVNAGIQILTSLLNGIAEALPTLTPAIVDAVLQIVQTITDNLPMILDAGLNIILALAEGIIESLPDLVEKLPIIIWQIAQFIVDSVPIIAKAGVELLKGLWQNNKEIEADMKAAIADFMDMYEIEWNKQFETWESFGITMGKAILQGLLMTPLGMVLDLLFDIGKDSVVDGTTKRSGSGKTFGSGSQSFDELKNEYFGDVPVGLSAEDKDNTTAITDAVKEIGDGATENSALISDAITQANINADDTTQEATNKIIAKIEENTRKAELIAAATKEAELILRRNALATWDPKTQSYVKPGGGYIMTSDGKVTTIPGNASGTDNWPGGLTWVGEKGPELMRLPRGTQIFSNEKSQKMSTVNNQPVINIYQPVASPYETARAVKTSMQKLIYNT